MISSLGDDDHIVRFSNWLERVGWGSWLRSLQLSWWILTAHNLVTSDVFYILSALCAFSIQYHRGRWACNSLGGSSPPVSWLLQNISTFQFNSVWPDPKSERNQIQNCFQCRLFAIPNPILFIPHFFNSAKSNTFKIWKSFVTERLWNRNFTLALLRTTQVKRERV